MKNILIIHHGQGVGGGLIALLGLIEELKVNNRITVFCIFDGIAVSYIEKTGVKVITPNLRFYRGIYSIFTHSDATYFGVLQQLIKLKSLLTFFLSKYIFSVKALGAHLDDFDVVYLNSTFISDWAYVAKKANKKVVIHIREPLSKRFLGYRIIRGNISKYCDWIIAISRDNASRVNLKAKTSIVYDPVVIKNRGGANEIIVDDNYKYFTYVGGAQRIKGFEQLARSLDYLEDDIRIFFLGGHLAYNDSFLKRIIRFIINPYAIKHEKLQKKLIKSKHIIFIGLTDDVFSYYKKSMFLISPFSKPHASLPVLEAFYHHLPVVVSNVKGMDELVNHTNGYFFKNKDYLDLAKTINMASKIGEEKYMSMRENSYKTYSSIRNNEIKIEQVLDNL